MSRGRKGFEFEPSLIEVRDMAKGQSSLVVAFARKRGLECVKLSIDSNIINLRFCQL